MATDKEILEELRNFDTPSITNVVATYPDNPLCLGLYNPWSQNWYTDDSIRCMFPELRPTVGYAVTCVYGLPDRGYTRLTGLDIFEAVAAAKKPSILVFEQRYPKEIAGKVGLAGGNMTTALKAMGCVGAISNGPSRDIDEIRPMKFQYLLSGATPGHGENAVHAINVPVSVAGMDVAPGEIVHMDENGACKFPADRLEAVLDKVRELHQVEAQLMERLSKATTAAQVKEAFRGHAYTTHKHKVRKRCPPSWLW